MESQSGDEPNFTSSGSASGSGPVSSSQNENSSPPWNYVTKLEKRGGAIGGTWNYRYNICGETCNGSYTRVKANLLQISGQWVAICKKVTRNKKKLEMLKLLEEWEKKKKQGASRETHLPC
ncbi:hypothetical protein V6N11_034168 [Hibiscus sabdariffa]|uniref:Uncharacterized protein n=1 Tax=Hibiscus sabdariffa TaxID=183260 RepID=A0ABR2S2G8_9ROSI